MSSAALALTAASCGWTGFEPETGAANADSLVSDGVDPRCGDCDDAEPCTIDRCTDNGCEHELVTDGAVSCIDDDTLGRCDAGVPSEISCLDACLAQGYNVYGGCDSEEIGCRCGSVPTMPCEPGYETCLGDEGIAVCEAASELGTDENLWHVYDCDELCAAEGLGAPLSCGVDPDDLTMRLCYCEDVCAPSCAEGEVCLGGTCYQSASPTIPDEDAECGADWQCGYKEACDAGQCVAVECKSDSDCGWCQRCYSNYCYDCGEETDGSCSCY